MMRSLQSIGGEQDIQTLEGLAEALRAYTLHGAQAAFDGDTRGSISAGKLADIAVLDRNLFEIDPRELLEFEVDLTIVDGKIVFER